jgi:hypothetical protein
MNRPARDGGDNVDSTQFRLNLLNKRDIQVASKDESLARVKPRARAA